jgi:hypothetical protein
MAKKLKLDWTYEPEGVLIAMVSTWPEYKLAWKIGKVLDFELVRCKDHQTWEKNGEKNSFILYRFNNEYTTFSLVKNKAYLNGETRQNILVPELKGFDYLLLVDTEAEMNYKELNQKLKQIEGVQLLQTFNSENLKSKSNLVF